jgi:hypothetical protein
MVIRCGFARRILVTTGAATALPGSSDRSRAAHVNEKADFFTFRHTGATNIAQWPAIAKNGCGW